MSVKALSAVFEESQARDSAFVVLLALADWADHRGRCYPSYHQIASKARVSRRTAVEAIHRLVALGELEQVPSGYRPSAVEDELPASARVQRRNLYQITLLRPRQLVQPLHYPANPAWPPMVQPAHVEGATDDEVMVQPAQVDGATDDRLMVQLTDLHRGIDRQYVPVNRPSSKPSSDPSVRKAGAAPRPLPPDNGSMVQLATGEARRVPLLTGTPAENVGVITKLAHELIDELGEASSDLADAVKEACVRARIAYDSAAVAKAIESARWQRARRSTDAGRRAHGDE